MTDEFHAELAKLCAAYDRPLTPEREAAYRTGLSKLAVPAFARVVDECVSERAPERMPTVRDCWTIYKRLRHARTVPTPTRAEEWQGSESLRLINNMYFIWLRAQIALRGSKDGFRTVGDAEMAERRAACRELALQHDLLLADRDPEATQDHLASSFADAMARIAPRDPSPTDLHVTWTNGQDR